MSKTAREDHNTELSRKVATVTIKPAGAAAIIGADIIEKREITARVIFGIPEDKELLAALGELSIKHGHLDHILKMTIRTLSGVSIEEALNNTTWRLGSAKLRKKIRKTAKDKLGEGDTLLRIDALLKRARRVTDKRNETIHSLWAMDIYGTPVVRKEDHSWKNIPTVTELASISNELEIITKEINNARLSGFIYEALKTVRE
jgi:hypothetical protein